MKKNVDISYLILGGAYTMVVFFALGWLLGCGGGEPINPVSKNPWKETRCNHVYYVCTYDLGGVLKTCQQDFCGDGGVKCVAGAEVGPTESWPLCEETMPCSSDGSGDGVPQCSL
jgi:hypothetical protein